MNFQYAWFLGSLGLFSIWSSVYLSLKNRESKKEMMLISLGTALLGLTEPLFVPAYWNPPSLFHLAQRSGFDIESFIFSFSIGGLAAIIFELLFPARHWHFTEKEKNSPRHRFHRLALVSPLVIFIFLYFFTKLNPIYSSSIAIFLGAVAAILCRPDLSKKIIAGGLIILSLYFLFFLAFNSAFPGYVQRVWNFGLISGILIFGIPVEELIFALAVGMLWSGIFEHINWRKIKNYGHN